LSASESYEHKRIKTLISERLKKWTGATLQEYQSSGHELDVFAVTLDGISIHVEIIWTNSLQNFFRDIAMIQASDAKVKLVVASPKIVTNTKCQREFEKIAVSQRRLGFAVHGDLIDGTKIIGNDKYLETEFKHILLDLLDHVQKQKHDGIASKQIQFQVEKAGEILPLLTRKKFNDAVIHTLQSNPMLLRAIIVGPLFLHPDWIMRRRLERESRESFSLNLRVYLEESIHQCNRDVRLIIRNSPRYLEILKELVRPNEVHDLVRDMTLALHDMFSLRSPLCVTFRCINTRYYHQMVATDKSCFIGIRKGEHNPIEHGYELKDQKAIEMELMRFDEVFDWHFRGNHAELRVLEKYIASLEHRI
jgi:hypothetical protein